MAPKVDFYATKIQANVIAERDDHEKSYDRLPDVPLFFGMVDLVKSSNYRLELGPKLGYARGETFFSMVRNVVSPCTAVRSIKEIGDAVLLVSTDARALTECLLLIDRVAHQLAAVAGDESYPFRVRAGLSFGLAKRLKRLNEDYLGSPIDQLARVLNAPDERTNLFIHEAAFDVIQGVLGDYDTFLSVSQSMQLSAAVTKGSSKPIYYRELIVDHGSLANFGENFKPWKDALSSRVQQER